MSTQSPTSIHGHDVIAILLDSPHTRPTLAAAVARRFGPDARFHTCSAADLTLDGLLALLIHKNKLTETPKGELIIDGSKVCKTNEPHDHSHDHHD